MSKLRIQKFLAEAGVASRRAAEEMVLQGRVAVNGVRVEALPCFVDPARDRVRVDGKVVRPAPAARSYFLLNKPRGVVCTQRDPSGRPRAVDLVPQGKGRLYCAGRLDVDSTGLVLLTNDGELTEYLTHPRHGVVKTYVVEIDGRITGDRIEKLKAGTYLDGKRTQGARVKVLRRGQARSLLEIRLTEGRNREVRRILARLGYKVRRLKRVAIGPITDRGLKVGHFRPLLGQEVRRLAHCGEKRKPSDRRKK